MSTIALSRISRRYIASLSSASTAAAGLQVPQGGMNTAKGISMSWIYLIDVIQSGSVMQFLEQGIVPDVSAIRASQLQSECVSSQIQIAGNAIYLCAFRHMFRSSVNIALLLVHTRSVRQHLLLRTYGIT